MTMFLLICYNYLHFQSLHFYMKWCVLNNVLHRFNIGPQLIYKHNQVKGIFYEKNMTCYYYEM